MEADESLARRLALSEEGEAGAGDDVESGGGGSSLAPARPQGEMSKRKRGKADYGDDSDEEEDDSNEDDSDEEEEEEGDDSDDDVEADIYVRNDENRYPVAVETRTRRTGRCLNRGQTEFAAPSPLSLPRKQSSTQVNHHHIFVTNVYSQVGRDILADSLFSVIR